MSSDAPEPSQSGVLSDSADAEIEQDLRDLKRSLFESIA
jgi:hypothetical protein